MKTWEKIVGAFGAAAAVGAGGVAVDKALEVNKAETEAETVKANAENILANKMKQVERTLSASKIFLHQLDVTEQLVAKGENPNEYAAYANKEKPGRWAKGVIDLVADLDKALVAIETASSPFYDAEEPVVDELDYYRKAVADLRAVIVNIKAAYAKVAAMPDEAGFLPSADEFARTLDKASRTLSEIEPFQE